MCVDGLRQFARITNVSDNEWTPTHRPPVADAEIVVNNWEKPLTSENFAGMAPNVTGSARNEDTPLAPFR